MYRIGRIEDGIIRCTICRNKTYVKPRWFEYHVEEKHMPLVDGHLQVARLIRRDDDVFLLSSTEFQEIVNTHGLVNAINQIGI